MKFPEGYDLQAQRHIADARQELCDNIEEALPYLIEALDDERYCMTIKWAEGDAYYNRSVGAICRNVIASNLEIYRGAMHFSGPQQWNRYNFTPISKEWWQTRKNRSLGELQVEAINWAIEPRKAEGENGKRRENEVSEMEKLRDGISNTRKPAKPSRMYRMANSGR